MTERALMDSGLGNNTHPMMDRTTQLNGKESGNEER